MEIFFELLKFYGFIFVYFISLIIACLILHICIKKFELTPYKVKIYGIFLNLSKLQIVSITSSFIKYTFVLWYVFSKGKYEISHLIFIIIISLIISVTARRKRFIPFDLLHNLFLLFALTSYSILLEYISEIMFNVYLLLNVMIIACLIVFYTTYLFVKEIIFVCFKGGAK